MNAVKDDIQQKVYHIADTYGYGPQSRMCMEEAAELIQSINKYHRARCDGDPLKMATARLNMIEEIADTQIMLWQMGYLTIGESEVLEVVEEKLNRQIERINRKERED